MITTKIVNIRYALVSHPYWWCDFRVYPDGGVQVWKVSDYNVDGWWSEYDEYEPNYDEIKQAGLEALKND